MRLFGLFWFLTIAQPHTRAGTVLVDEFHASSSSNSLGSFCQNDLAHNHYLLFVLLHALRRVINHGGAARDLGCTQYDINMDRIVRENDQAIVPA